MGDVHIAASLVHRGAKEPQDIVESMERGGADWGSVSEFMLGVASECINLRYYDAAERVLNTVLDLSRKNGDRKTEGECLNDLGRLMRTRGRGAEAVRFYSEAASISVELGDAMGLGVAHSHIAENLWLQGDLEGALRHSRRACEAFRTVEEAGAEVVERIGDILLELRRYEEAYGEYREAIRLAERLEDLKTKGSCLFGAGEALRGMGRLEEALEAYLEAIRIDRNTGNRLGERVCLVAAGVVLLRLGRVEESLEQFNRALRISRDGGDVIGEANALFHIGVSNILLKNDLRVVEAFEASIQTFEEWNVSVPLLVALNIYSDYLLSRGESKKAEEISRRISQYKLDGSCEDPLVQERVVEERIGEMREILKQINGGGKTHGSVSGGGKL